MRLRTKIRQLEKQQEHKKSKCLDAEIAARTKELQDNGAIQWLKDLPRRELLILRNFFEQGINSNEAKRILEKFYENTELPFPNSLFEKYS